MRLLNRDKAVQFFGRRACVIFAGDVFDVHLRQEFAETSENGAVNVGLGGAKCHFGGVGGCMRASDARTRDLHRICWQSPSVAEHERSETKPRRKPRLGILIRLAIYLPLLGFFGWRAWERFANEREAADEVFRERVGQWLEHPPQTMILPNGEALPMLTPEQAAAQGYELPDSFSAESDEPPTTPTQAPSE